MILKDILKQLEKYAFLGRKSSQDGALMIGHAPHKGKDAWLHIIYPGITLDEIDEIEKAIGNPMPEDYKLFLKESNGLSLFGSRLSFFGFQRNLIREGNFRQPFSIINVNTYERLANLPANYFCIGTYSYDGSKLYLNLDNNEIIYCERYGYEPLRVWKSFSEMILSEVSRLIQLHDDKGILIGENSKLILPI